MEKYIINGGRPLFGEVTVSGAKNAALPILAATILSDGECRIENIPEIRDVSLMIEILYKMGAEVRTIDRTTVEIEASRIYTTASPNDICRRLRGSYYLLGAMLGKYGKVEVEMPGGCNFGVRPIDLHIKGLEALGAHIEIEGGIIKAAAPDGLKGATIYLDKASVGATINIMLAAVRAEGTTLIENAAREPHIVDLANFLNSMGAYVRGAGTDTIKIKGVSSLIGVTYSIIPDQIEAGTFMIASAITGGDVVVKNIIPKHMESLTSKLIEAGMEVEELDEAIRVVGKRPINKIKVTAIYYPGFPTDLQPQITAMLSLAEGTSIVTESVWENRFRYTEELKKMGADISVDGRVATVSGVKELHGATVTACDLRAGAAVILAGLAAEGETVIENIVLVERGYEDIVGKLRALGAEISKESFNEPAI